MRRLLVVAGKRGDWPPRTVLAVDFLVSGVAGGLLGFIEETNWLGFAIGFVAIGAAWTGVDALIARWTGRYPHPDSN